MDKQQQSPVADGRPLMAPAPAPAAAAPPQPLTWLRRHWTMVAGLGLVPIGLVVTILGLGLVFNFWSLRFWMARRIPFLAGLIAQARGPLDKNEATLLEGMAAGLGLCLMAVALAIALSSVSRLRVTSPGARRLKRLGSGVMSLSIIGLLLLAVAVPFLALDTPPALRAAMQFVRQLIFWALRGLPGF